MLQLHIALKLNFAPNYASNASTPFHNTCSSSISGYKYISTFVDVQNFLGMIKANIKNISLSLVKEVNFNFNLGIALEGD